jgi:hypothetical protein
MWDVSEKCDERAWTDFMWFRTGTSEEFLQRRRQLLFTKKAVIVCESLCKF